MTNSGKLVYSRYCQVEDRIVVEFKVVQFPGREQELARNVVAESFDLIIRVSTTDSRMSQDQVRQFMQQSKRPCCDGVSVIYDHEGGHGVRDGKSPEASDVEGCMVTAQIALQKYEYACLFRFLAQQGESSLCIALFAILRATYAQQCLQRFKYLFFTILYTATTDEREHIILLFILQDGPDHALTHPHVTQQRIKPGLSFGGRITWQRPEVGAAFYTLRRNRQIEC